MRRYYGALADLAILLVSVVVFLHEVCGDVDRMKTQVDNQVGSPGTSSVLTSSKRLIQSLCISNGRVSYPIPATDLWAH